MFCIIKENSHNNNSRGIATSVTLKSGENVSFHFLMSTLATIIEISSKYKDGWPVMEVDEIRFSTGLGYSLFKA